MSETIKTKLQDVKRELILDEAAVLFETLGFEQLKVSELAKSVGVSVGSIYGLFESKEGLYFAYVQHQIAHHAAILEERIAEIESGEMQLRTVFGLKFETMAAKRKAVEECVYNNPLFFASIRHASPEMFDGIYAILAEIILRINPALDAAQAERLAYICIGMSDGYVAHWLRTEEDLMQQIDTMIAQMLSLIKGVSCPI